MTRILLTVDGAERLREELNRLKKVERPMVIQAIAEARAHGDLSENAEFDAAKDRQGFVEGRISELESQLSVAEIIDPSRLNPGGRVVFGSHVDLYDLDEDRELSYQIVGELEAAVEDGRISVTSPIGKSLIGKNEGDEVSVDTPGGTRNYEVLKVSCKPA